MIHTLTGKRDACTTSLQNEPLRLSIQEWHKRESLLPPARAWGHLQRKGQGFCLALSDKEISPSQEGTEVGGRPQEGVGSGSSGMTRKVPQGEWQERSRWTGHLGRNQILPADGSDPTLTGLWFCGPGPKEKSFGIISLPSKPHGRKNLCLS